MINIFNQKIRYSIWRIGFWLLASILFVSCKQQTESIIREEVKISRSLFSLVEPGISNVHFKNVLSESGYMNRFVYEYFYNGGGVAIADFNNDGFDDLYFTSNLESNRLYLNNGNMTFKDVTVLSGTSGKKGWSTGVTVVDINQDGLMDIYACRSGRFKDDDQRRNELFVNQGLNQNGIPVFIEEAKKYGLDDDSFSTQALFLDFDRDGDLDMFLANHNIEPPPNDINDLLIFRNGKSDLTSNKIYLNNGGIFKNVSSTSGIVNTQLNYSLGISAGDLNNDGWPDLYIANDYAQPDQIYINQQNVTFINKTQECLRQMPNFSMGSDIGDINNDGYADIMSLDMVASDNYGIKTSMSGMNTELFNAYVQNGLHYQYMYNALQLNNGMDGNNIPKFSNIAQIAGVSSTYWSWAPLFLDYDNDGFQDLFITNGVKRDFRNNDFNIFLKKATIEVIENKLNPLPFYKEWTSKSPQQRVPNFLFNNTGHLSFQQMKMGEHEHPSFSNGAAYGDLDNDGDLDLVVSNVDEEPFIYRNNSDSNNYLSVKLSGSQENRNGIGAKIQIYTDGRKQMREIYTTRGYQSAVPPKVFFGLGETNLIDSLIVEWPDGKISKTVNVEVNRQIEIVKENASSTNNIKFSEQPVFVDITSNSGVEFTHSENDFNDFNREILLPHKMSEMGPTLSVGDINGDGLEDFFIGGGRHQAAKIYFQNSDNTFKAIMELRQDKGFEDTASLLFDADGDGDLDLCVASGSNEDDLNNANYRVRLYQNNEGKFFKSKSFMSELRISSSAMACADYDNDGDLDLIIGGRQLPGKYPLPASSYLLQNQSSGGVINFEDVTENIAPILAGIGMVTDVSWIDIDNDKTKELIICGEWMPIMVLKYIDGKYENRTAQFGFQNTNGWWNTIKVLDLDNDGDLDVIAGNLGLNYKYKTSTEKPFEIYAHDFDDSGSLDIVLGYHQNSSLYPLRGRECSSQQIPLIKTKFPTYHSFGEATLQDIYNPDMLAKALNYKAQTFANMVYINRDSKFVGVPLNIEAQLSSINSFVIEDLNNDGRLDILYGGNKYGSEVETPRNDASYGGLLLGSKEDFKPVMGYQSGLFIEGEINTINLIKLASGEKAFIIARNNEKLRIFKPQHN